MSIISALYAGASGMSAMSRSIQVIGNNIANLNTVGFKGSRAEFSDLLSQAIPASAGNQQIGRGVDIQSVRSLFEQGSFLSTPVVTDVALNGGGFFVLTKGEETFFTRAGNFRIDNGGFLTSSLGMRVNGLLYDVSGNPTTTRGEINLSGVTAPPNQTGDGSTSGSGVLLNLNLDSSTAVPTAPFDVADPSETSQFSTSVTVYDSLGAHHTVMVYFNKTDENQWEWHALVNASGVNNTVPAEQDFYEGASGVLEFDGSGKETSFTTDSPAVGFDFVGGANPGQVIGLNFAGSTQVATASVINTLTQDGFAAGSLQSIDIDADGVITGRFTNGKTRALSQLSVASFAAEAELGRMGNSLFVSTDASGQPIYGVGNAGGNGSIATGTLELSNVDLTTEFINLITSQRAYQANTKIVTVGDQLLETVIQMRR